MEKVILLVILKWCLVASREVSQKEDNQDLQSSRSDKVFYEYIVPAVPFPEIVTNHKVQNNGVNALASSNLPLLPQPQVPKIDLHAIIDGNPLLAALLLGASLGLSPKPPASNHPELLPINPYVALLLSQYGRYVPSYTTRGGLYGYAAANNYHNNKPFGSYKVYEDAK